MSLQTDTSKNEGSNWLSNRDEQKGKWNQLKGKAKEQFGQLTDDDMLKADGSVTRMIGVLQERYGYSKERAQDEWNKFMDGYGQSTTGQNPEMSSIKSTASDGLNHLSQDVKEIASNVVEQSKQALSETMDDVGKRADALVNDQKQQAARKLQGVASAIRSSSDQLRENEQETFADYANAAANYVDEFSTFLRNRHPMELWSDVQTFARRQPEVFVLGTLAAGFLVGRFLRKSESSEQASYTGKAAPARYTKANASRSSRQNAPDGQDIYVERATSDSYDQWRKYASEGGTESSKVSTPATFATPTRSEDQPK